MADQPFATPSTAHMLSATAAIAKARMTEPCDLPTVEARRPIGRNWLAAAELPESCIARIEAVGHTVNANPARDFSSARATAKQAGAAVTRAESLPALHGLPIGIEDLEDSAGLRITRLRLRK